MDPSEKKRPEQDSDQASEDPLPPPQSQKDRAMASASSDTKLVLSCWWSRGPSGQVQEWESRPTTTEGTPRADVGHRQSSTRWVRTSNKKKNSKTSR